MFLNNRYVCLSKHVYCLYFRAKQEKLKETIDALMQKDRVLRFVGVPPETSREDLKDVFEEFGEIAWIDFSRGETEVCCLCVFGFCLFSFM